MRLSIILCVLLGLASLAQAQEGGQRVTVTGCPADGQTGSIAAPPPSSAMAPIATRVGALGFYRASEGERILAPRGWHCFSVYGANGRTLFVTPQTVQLGVGSKLSTITGPLIVVSESYTDTSGRFAAAQVVARLFPKLRGYVQDVMSEGLVPQEDFVFRPYPADKLTYHGDDVAEFATASGGKGLGDDLGVVAEDGMAVRGAAVAINGVVVVAAVRLSPDMNDISTEIVRQVMREPHGR